MSKAVPVDVEIARVFATAAIRAVKQQCSAKITVAMPSYRKAGFPATVDVASFIELDTARFKGSMALCYPRQTFLWIVRSMTGETHELINRSVRDGAAELLNIIYGEVKSVLNEKGYSLPMAIPQVHLADAALERLLDHDPAILIPFETQFGPFFAQIGIPKQRLTLVQPAAGPEKRQVPAGLFAAETRILVVDDMTTMRKVVCRTLNGLGYTDIVEADDGKTAWDEIVKACAAGRPFGLMLSDWNMPIMKGIDLLKKVRGNPATKGVPFVLLTAESELKQVLEATSAGANAYILKPFTAESVTTKLREVNLKMRGMLKAA